MEASGMFGDFGTLLPLLLAMANVGSVAPAAALFWFGAFNVATAYEWDVPMCVQPMKTIAAAAIADGLDAQINVFEWDRMLRDEKEWLKLPKETWEKLKQVPFLNDTLGAGRGF